MYVGDYKSGKFHGKGTYHLTQGSTPGPTAPDTKETSFKAQGKATECGWPIIWIPTAIDTKDATKVTRKMGLENITGRIRLRIRGTF